MNKKPLITIFCAIAGAIVAEVVVQKYEYTFADKMAAPLMGAAAGAILSRPDKIRSTLSRRRGETPSQS